jgi:hypothetical protein
MITSMLKSDNRTLTTAYNFTGNPLPKKYNRDLRVSYQTFNKDEFGALDCIFRLIDSTLNTYERGLELDEAI